MQTINYYLFKKLFLAWFLFPAYLYAQYCTPSFYNGEFGDKISNVSTNGALINFNNSSGGDPNGYGDYSSTHAVTALVGSSFTVTVSYGGCFSGIGIWVDWNNDGTFDSSEKEVSTPNFLSPQGGTISVPTTTGSYRMRVMALCFTSDPPNPCLSSTLEGEAEDYTIHVVSQNPCSGTPQAGIVSISDSQENAGNPYTIWATGHSVIDLNYTYQWQSNTNGAGWVNLGTATSTYADINTTAHPTKGTIITYRLIITCTNSNLSDTSNVVTFMTSQTYCYPQQSASSIAPGINNVNKYISGFSTTNGIIDISNLNSGKSSQGYYDYSLSHQALFSDNSTVNFTVNLISPYTSGSTWNAEVWIDWNQDGNFTLAERVYVSPSPLPNTSNIASGSFFIPASTEGYFRMRVIHRLGGLNVTDACFLTHGDVEDYTLIVTAQSCMPPVDLLDTPNTFTNTTLSWTAFGGGTEFELQWGNQFFALGSGTLVNGLSDTFYSVNTVVDQWYDFYVRTKCSNGSYSMWSGPYSFHTGYCIPNPLNGCSFYSKITNFEMYDAVTNLAHFTGLDACDTLAYGNYSHLYAEAYPGPTISYKLQTGGILYFKIWVDWNKNGVFDLNEAIDSGTMVYPAFTHTGTINVPNTISAGDYRLRVRVSGGVNNASELQACAVVPGTEIEDYTLRVLPSPCANISNLTQTNVTTTSVNINWTAGSSETSWDIEYGPAGFTIGSGTSLTVTTPSASLSGLSANTAYDIYVRATCSGGLISGWESIQITTLTCLPVSNISITNITSTTATVSWTAGGSETAWNIEYGLAGFAQGSGMTAFASGTPTTTLSGLSANTTYDIYIRASCFGGSVSTWISSQFSTTVAPPPPPCIAITNLSSTSISENSISVSWTAGGSETTWNIEYGTAGFSQGSGTNLTVSATNATLSGLTANTAYDIYVRANCGGTNVSSWLSAQFTTSTASVPPCQAISNIQTTNISTNSISISWTAGGSETTWNIEYGVAGFTQGSGTNLTVSATNATISGLTANTAYDIYVRANCGDTNVSTWLSAQFTTSTANVPPCLSIQNLISTSSSPTSISLSWESQGSETVWNIEYGEEGFSQGSGTTVFATGTPNITVENLTPNTTYDFYVQAYCADGQISPSVFGQFTSDSQGNEGSPCASITNLTTTNTTSTSITISWESVGEETAWHVEYGVAGFIPGSGIFISVSATSITLIGLLPNTTYDIYVRANCGNSLSTWTKRVVSTTNGDGNLNLHTNTSTLNVTIFPNPTHDELKIDVDLQQASFLHIEIQDLNGKIIQTNTQTNVTGQNTIILPVHELSKGVYPIIIKTRQGLTIKKMIKQ